MSDTELFIKTPFDSVCLHEAGHAVVGRATGYHVDLLQAKRNPLRRDAALEGRCAVLNKPIGVVDFMCFDVAGNRAQRLFYPHHDPKDEAQYEYDNVRRCIAAFALIEPRMSSDLFERVIARTDRILNANVCALRDLQIALIASGMLRGKRLRELLSDVVRLGEGTL